MSQHKVDRISPFGTNGTQLDDPRADSLKAATSANGVAVTDLRQIGPLFNTRVPAYGALGTGAVDDGGAIALAETAASAVSGGVEHSPGTYRINSNRTFTQSHVVQPGAIIKPANNVTVTFSGHVRAGLFAWIDESLGGSVLFTGPTTTVEAVWFKECTTKLWTPVTPKTPTVVDGPTSLYGMGSAVAGHSYKASTTRWSMDASGVARETGPSPLSATLVAVNEGTCGVVPEDPGCGLEGSETGIAIGFSAYIRDLADGIDHRATYAPNGSSDGFTLGYVQGWSDIPDYLGCAFCGYDAGKPAPPAGGTTGIDVAGGVVKVPPTAPTLVQLGALQRNATYNFAISYTYGDGSEGPLSSTGSCTIGNHPGGHAIVYPAGVSAWTNTELPIGVHFINVYGAKSGDTLRRVKRLPVGAQSIEIHDIPAVSDNPTRDPSVAYYDAYNGITTTHPVYPGQGACISTMSPLQLACRSVRDSGGGRGVRVPSGISTVKAPLILDGNPNFVNALGETGYFYGLRIFADGSLNGNAEMRYQPADWDATVAYGVGATVLYNGTAYYCILANTNQVPTNATYWDTVNKIGYAPYGWTGIFSDYSRLTIQNVRFTDNKYRLLRYALRFGDYTGGGSQFCRLEASAFEANAPHSIGIIGDASSGGANSHTVSEIMILGGFVGGARGAIYFAGSQTGDIHLDQLVQLQSGSDADPQTGRTSANSYVIRHACANSVLTSETQFVNGGNYRLFLTDGWTREGGGAPVFYARSLGGESHNANGGSFGVYESTMDINGGSIRLTGECGFQNSTPHAFYDLYVGSRARLTSINNIWNNPVVVDHAFAETNFVGGKTNTLLKTARFYGGGQAPSNAYPLAMVHGSSVQADTLQGGVVIAGTSNITAGIQHTIITIDTSTGNRTVTIPSALYRPGQIIIVKKITADANTVTISSLGDQSNNGKTFDGAAAAAIPGGTKGAIMLFSDGTEWKLGPKF